MDEWRNEGTLFNRTLGLSGPGRKVSGSMKEPVVWGTDYVSFGWWAYVLLKEVDLTVDEVL